LSQAHPVFENLAVANQAEDTDANPTSAIRALLIAARNRGVSFGNYPLEFRAVTPAAFADPAHLRNCSS
jgi:hypothetical protein